MKTLASVTRPSFCTKRCERVYITAKSGGVLGSVGGRATVLWIVTGHDLAGKSDEPEEVRESVA